MAWISPTQHKLNLALQGGGAHGAFTWGVLDRLLEEEDITIGWVSGIERRRRECGSACGWPRAEAAREAARAKLRQVWGGRAQGRRAGPIASQSASLWRCRNRPMAHMASLWSPV